VVLNLIVDANGNPTTVLCVSPSGEEFVCRTKEELAEAFLKMPNCQLWFGNKENNDEHRPE
jgi:hypothetical protein